MKHLIVLTFLFRSIWCYFIWLGWQPWSSVCERKCSEPIGVKHRSRECLLVDVWAVTDPIKCAGDHIEYKYCDNQTCHGTGEYEITSYSFSTSQLTSNNTMNNLLFQKFQVDQEKTLHGNGSIELEIKRGCICLNDEKECDYCFKTWTEWSPWLGCFNKPVPTSRKESRIRSCVGFGKDCSCPSGSNQPCSVEYRDCNMDKNYTIVIEGDMTVIDEKNCSTECELVYKTIQRNCTVTNYDGSRLPCETKMLCDYYYCSSQGGWSDWSEWSCDSLYYGTRRRTRECDNPKPFHGGQCEGSAEDWDICHEQLEELGESIEQIPIYQLKTLSDFYQKTKYKSNYIFKPWLNSNVLDCGNSLTKALYNIYPTFEIKWAFNGQEIKPNVKRDSIFDLFKRKKYVVEGTKLIVNKPDSEDIGVYICYTKLSSKNQIVILNFMSVRLQTDEADSIKTVVKSPGESFTMECRNLEIKYILDSGAQLDEVYLEMGGSRVIPRPEYSDYDFIEYHDTDQFKIEELTAQDEGVYRCMVYNTLQKKYFETNKIKLVIWQRNSQLLKLTDKKYWLVIVLFSVACFLMYLLTFFRDLPLIQKAQRIISAFRPKLPTS